MSLETYLQVYLPALDRELRLVADRFLPGPEEFDRMVRYHLGWVDEEGLPAQAGRGKQIRPAIVLLCTELVGGDWQQALPAAAAVELLHNFSLIHDDVEDNSPLRRGRPSVWKVWGKANAINVGDAMFALAHLALWRLAECKVPFPVVLEAFHLYERTCLTLTRGQHLDMAFEHRLDVSIDEYVAMIDAKSAALIATSAQLGAVVGGIPLDETEPFVSFGRSLGRAFQIRDDILGIWGDPELTGKSAATDIVSRKKSLPVLYGLERSSELVEIYSHEHQGEAELDRAVAILDGVGAREFAADYEARCFRDVDASLDALSVFSGAVVGVLRVLVAGLLGRSV